jgi:hypothetical protein
MSYPQFLGPKLTTQDYQYIKNTWKQYINMAGMPVTYETRVDGPLDIYNQPTFTFTNTTVYALISQITKLEYRFIEEGLLPPHDAKLWVYTTNAAVSNAAPPKPNDRVIWENIEFEIRGVFPVTVGTAVVYYEIMLRRLI